MDARRTVRVVARALTALVSAAALVATGLAWSLQHRLDTGVVTSRAAVAVPRPIPEGGAFTALLVGLDARTDAAGNPLPTALLDAMHAGPDEGQLHTDTIILLHVPAGTGEPAVAISIPRDSFVPIAGDRGTHKINSAYERGMGDAEDELRAEGVTGAELDRRAREAGRSTLVTTVEALTGARVDRFAEINLAGFLELTDALGGVPVCLNRPAHDSYSGVDLPAGPQTVSGAAALAFVRQRHGLDGGDLDRIARQQAFASGLIQQVLTTGALADPRRMQGLVDVITRYVVLDSGWDVGQAVSEVRRVAADDMTFRTIPTGRPDLRTPVDGIAVEIDQDAVRSFVRSTLGAAAATATTPSSTSPTPRTTEPGPAVRTGQQTAVPRAAAAPSTATPTTAGPAPTPTPTPTARSVTTGSATIPCVD
jgi:LCP family protein required for cell wall assembly